MRTKKDKDKFILLRKFLPLFLLPEKYQIILFNKFPPSKEPIGIKFKKPKSKFNMPTLEVMLIEINSWEALLLLIKSKIDAVAKHNRGLTIAIFIFPKAVWQYLFICTIAPRK